MSLNPKELQDLLDELEASRASRKRAWENLQEIRRLLKDVAGVELPAPARKTVDLEGRDGVRKTIKRSADCSGRAAQGGQRVQKIYRSTANAARGRLCPRGPGAQIRRLIGRRSFCDVECMCGRYRRTTSEEEIACRYHIPIPPPLDLPISYNIAPTQNVLAVRYNRKQGNGHWMHCDGLIPSWAKDEKIAYKTINARVETFDTAPSYRQAFKRRRCLLPVDTFYEWHRSGNGKIPYAIGMKDDSVFVFAGLWESWKPPGTQDWIDTCTIITGEPNDLVREIHTRMPVILPDEVHDASLSGEAGKEILVPFPAEKMKAWAISQRVNSPRNNDPDILTPVEA